MNTLIGPKQVFEFDLNGFLVVRGFLSARIVTELNDILDRQPSARTAHKFHFVTLDERFIDLLVDPRVLEVCQRWINPYFRFDHAWGVQHYPNEPKSDERKNLHGGPYQEMGYFQYHWYNGAPTCSCIIFAYVLEPQRKGDGGFVVVPGSHKSNLGFSGPRIFSEFLQGDHENANWVFQPELEAGDLLIFTEATIHGTERWKISDRRRRNLYYKYGYGFMGWPPHDNDEIQQLRRMARSEQEANLFRPPYVSTTSGNELCWRPTTLLTATSPVPPSGSEQRKSP
jgi:hypothetical protein